MMILMIISIFLGNTLKFNISGSDIMRVRFYYSLAIFMNLIPIAHFLLEFRKAKERPIFFIGFIFYYLIILPIWISFSFEEGMIENLNLTRASLVSLNWVIGLNLILLLISQLFIFKYVFIDILSGRRRAKSSDIGIVFLTYITLGVTFGFFYILIIKNNPNALGGMILDNLGGIELYFRGIYFSFITLTSVGYGEIIPISLLAQMVAMLESILGVLLVSFSLGIVFSSNLNTREEKERAEKIKSKEHKNMIEEKLKEKKEVEFEDHEYKGLKKQLMKEFEEILDKNIEKYIEKKGET